MTRHTRYLLYGLFLLTAFSGAASAQTYGPPIKWRGFGSAASSLISADTTVVMENEGAWRGFWSRLTGSQPESAAKDVDFNTQAVVAVVLGNRRLGTTVMIKSVQQTSPGEVTVKYIEQPAPPFLAGHSTSNPYDIIRMDKVASRIKFVKEMGDPGFYSQLDNADSGGSDCPWRPYGWSNNSPFDSPISYVITDQGAFDMYWQRLRDEKQGPSDVDWDQYSVVAIHTGKVPRGTTIYVDSVKRVKNKIVVSYHEAIPEAGLMDTTASPFVILRVPKGKKGIELKKLEPVVIKAGG